MIIMQNYLPNLPTDILSRIVNQVPYQNKTALCCVCTFFQQLIQRDLANQASLFPFNDLYSITSINTGNKMPVGIAVHDMALNILVLGWKVEAPDNSIGAIYHLDTGKQKQLLLDTGKKKGSHSQVYSYREKGLRYAIIDRACRQIIGGYNISLNVWDMDGNLKQKLDLDNRANNHSYNIAYSGFSRQAVLKYNDQTSSLQHVKLANDHPQPFSSAILSAEQQGVSLNCDGKRGWTMYTNPYTANRNFKVIRSNDQSVIETIKHSGPIAYVEKEGCVIYENVSDKSNRYDIVFYDISQQQTVKKIELKNGERVNQLIYHDKTNHLIGLTSSEDHPKQLPWINIWNIKTGQQLNRFMSATDEAYHYYIDTILYLPEVNAMIGGISKFSTRYCYIWDLTEKKLVQTIKLTAQASISQLSYNLRTNQLYITQGSIKQTHYPQEMSFDTSRISFQ